MQVNLKLLIVILFCVNIQLIVSQDSIPFQIIEEVLLTDFRIKKGLSWAFHKDTLKFVDIFQPSLRQVFDRQVGLQSFNGENFAQDIRISIRGFGGRSSFGIRGIRLYQDGIPLTSPDGTTQLDELSGFDIQSMEVVRSGMSARLGNSGAGAISLKSTDYFNGVKVLSNIQQFGAYSTGIKYGMESSKYSNLLSLNHHYFNGKREYSHSRNTTVYNKLRLYVNDKWQLEWFTGLYWSPLGTDPGSRSLNEIASSKFSANQRNVEYKAGEKVNGLMTALSSKYTFNKYSFFQSNVFYRKRNFEALLPFEAGGWINLNRDFVGMSNAYEMKGVKHMTFTIGHTLEYQNDKRKLFRNLKGSKGSLTSDQYETVLNMAVYQQLNWSPRKWDINQLMRFDFNQYQLHDHFISDGIQEGNQHYRNLNGALGVGYKLNHNFRLFSNFSTSFEMPSLNELSNNPVGPGFNPSLLPEKSVQIESGFSSRPYNAWTLEASLFFIRVYDQISAYELSTTPGRSYYRNAGITNRRGVEISLIYLVEENINLNINYVWSDYRYVNFISGNNDFSGNTQTLIPKHKWHLTASFPLIKYFGAQVSAGYNDAMWLEDSNHTKSKPYGELNFLLHTSGSFSQKIQVGLQLNNVFNLMEYSNFRANAAGMRYYEIATPMNMGMFLKVDFNR